VRLKMRFDKVTGKENEIDALLKLWEKDGIDTAIQKFGDNNSDTVTL